MFGVFQPNRSPPDRNGNVNRPTVGTRGDCVIDPPWLLELLREDLRREEPGDARAEDVDGDAGDDVVDTELHGGDRVQQTADTAAECTEEQSPPRTELQRAPRTEPGAEDHHAFEPDVDDTGALGEQATETRQQDGHPPPQHRPTTSPLPSAGWCRRSPARR